MEIGKIEINRNIIERSLMVVKSFYKKNKRALIYTTVAVLGVIILIIGGVIYYQSEAKRELVEFDKIMDEYNKLNESDGKDRIKRLQDVIGRMRKLVDESHWGYVSKNGYYIIAAQYQMLNMNKEANECFLKFADMQSNSFFSPLALRQVAVIYENMGNFDEALKIYLRMQKEYIDSEVADGICYDLGRVYHKGGDIPNARKYYNKLISLYPASMFAQKAKNRLFLLGNNSQKDRNRKPERIGK